MVKVRNSVIIHSKDWDLRQWLDALSKRVHEFDYEAMYQACLQVQALEAADLAHHPHGWGELGGCFRIAVEMASLLVDLEVDGCGLLAAILYRAVREELISLEEVAQRFGQPVVSLIQGVLQMAVFGQHLDAFTGPGPALGQPSDQRHNIRKMLIAMVEDVRVALIKLAERTCAIRAVKGAEDGHRLRVAREVFDIYAPLAHRLGVGHLKWELEDLSFRYLYAEQYKQIAHLIDEKRVEREAYIEKVSDTLKSALASSGIVADVSGRAKHIYSIWRKMQKKNIDFYQIYDIRAVRVMVDTVANCYAALGIVHALWHHIPKEFDDYIATPKENGYRSLHTAVLGPDSKVLEVQIRTQQMHDEAELGVCAHWHYKEGTRSGAEDALAYEHKIAWLRQVLEWQEDLDNENVQELVSELRQDVVDERIYVFTPDGHVVDMQVGATPLDFAYHVHTEVGHRCIGAKVNGRIVSLKHQLKTGDRVEVLTGKRNNPSRDWLNANLHFVVTSRAKAKIQQWFKLQDRDHNLEEGKQLLERELTRLRLSVADWDPLVAALKLSSEEELFVGLGASSLKLGQVINVIHGLQQAQTERETAKRSAEEQWDLASQSLRRRSPVVQSSPSLVVEGVSDLMIHLAGCCQPVPGDQIAGYVSLGRGVSVHRTDCAELARLQTQYSDRILTADWELESDQRYPVNIEIYATHRSGLLRDISTVLANMNMNVLNVNTQPLDKRQTAKMNLTVEIAQLDQLGDLLTRLGQLPGIFEVNRQLST